MEPKRAHFSASRLARELARIDPETDGVTVTLRHDRVTLWDIEMEPPKGSPYDVPGRRFELTMTFSASYPSDPPDLVFKTKVFHPNINDAGSICMSLLKTKGDACWKPRLRAMSLLQGLRSLLMAPNTSDPYNADAAAIFDEAPEAYREEARSTMELHGKNIM